MSCNDPTCWFAPHRFVEKAAEPESPTPAPPPIDPLRAEIAKAALQGLVAADLEDDRTGAYLADKAVFTADCLIAELRKSHD